MTDTAGTHRVRLIAIAIIVVAIGAGVWRIARPQPATVRQVSNATITTLDAAGGVAEIEFVHPKSGQTMRLSAAVGPGCAITLDGKPATIADLRVGDHADVRGVVKKGLFGASVEPQQVTVTRGAATAAPANAPTRAPAGAPTSAPANTSAGAAPGAPASAPAGAPPAAPAGGKP